MLLKRPTQSREYDNKPKIVPVEQKDPETGHAIPNTFAGTMVRVHLADDRDMGVFLEVRNKFDIALLHFKEQRQTNREASLSKVERKVGNGSRDEKCVFFMDRRLRTG